MDVSASRFLAPPLYESPCPIDAPTFLMVADDIQDGSPLSRVPLRIGERHWVDSSATQDLLVLDRSFNGRKQVRFDNSQTEAIARKLPAYELAPFVSRVATVGKPWSLYARLRRGVGLAGPVNAYLNVIGGSGARNVMIGFAPPIAMMVYNVNYTGDSGNIITPTDAWGNTESYLWAGNGLDITFRRNMLVSNVTLNGPSTAAVTQAAIGHYQADTSAATHHEFHGGIEVLAGFERVLTESEYYQLDAWICSRLKRRVILEGDSITIGSSGAGAGSAIERFLGPEYQVQNYAVGAQTLETVMQKLDLRTIPSIIPNKSTCILLAGTNSIAAGTSLDNLKALTQEYISRVDALKGDPRVCTILPRGNFSQPMEDIRVSHKQWLESEYPQLTIPTGDIPQLQNTSNTDWFSDASTHPTERGVREMGGLIAKRVTG